MIMPSEQFFITGVFAIVVICLFILLISSSMRKKKNPDLQHAERFLNELDFLSTNYVDHTLYCQIKSEYLPAYAELKHRTFHEKADNVIKDLFIQKFEEFQNIDLWNERFIVAEMQRKKSFFHDIGGIQLDEQQQRAVITDEINQLVVAGAGSGKTKTIIAKILYLVKHKGINPDEILALAFNTRAAQDLNEELEKQGISTKAFTFHAFGRGLIDCRNKAPDSLMYQVIKKCLLSIHQINERTTKAILYFLGVYIYSFSANDDISNTEGREDELESLKSQYERIKNDNRESIRGEQMRSIEEVMIANHLYLHGVSYVYEKLYPHPGDDYGRRYYPDFYLPEYDVYLEHFGVDERGEVPWLSEEEAQKYKAEMQWKREFHKKNGTRLIESYSWWKRGGNLIKNLDALLIKNGIEYKKIDVADIYKTIIAERIEKNRIVDGILKLIASFLCLFKENNNKTIEDLKKEKANSENTHEKHRSLFFLQIFSTIFNEYESKLKETNQIDFPDMIRIATQKMEQGACSLNYKYIIVDEFQDISGGRARFLLALRNLTQAKVFCVGDDWQSIYRFTGSDVDYLVHFEKYFGYSKVLKIERTYRYSQEIINAVQPFIMANPNQITKAMRSHWREEKPVRIVQYMYNKEKALSMAVEEIIKDYGEEKKILLLLRNNADIIFLKYALDWEIIYKDKAVESIIYRKYPNAIINVLTIHKAKGAEADNIILVNADDALLGFPNQIADDPLLQMLLANADKYPFAEERRLFYVALTRTKHRSYILAPAENQSTFIEEIQKNPNVKTLILDKHLDIADEFSCPSCKSGRLSIRSGKNGDFYGCSNYPKCKFTRSIEDIIEPHEVPLPELREDRDIKTQDTNVSEEDVNAHIGMDNWRYERLLSSNYQLDALTRAADERGMSYGRFVASLSESEKQRIYDEYLKNRKEFG